MTRALLAELLDERRPRFDRRIRTPDGSITALAALDDLLIAFVEELPSPEIGLHLAQRGWLIALLPTGAAAIRRKVRDALSLRIDHRAERARAGRRSAAAESRRRKRELGECYDCSRSALPGRTRCEYHAALMAAMARRRRGEKK